MSQPGRVYLFFAAILAAVTVLPLQGQAPSPGAASGPPILDMHMHARTAAFYGTPPLTPEQKRDIFYNNAARFLRLSDAEIARHHGKTR